MMALMKFFARIAPLSANGDNQRLGSIDNPETQFAVALAALFNDVDHDGVPNSQLVKEKVVAAAVYNNQCVAEQNSMELCWSLLMSAEYVDLRRTIYTSEAEFKSFRQLIVNSVLASDIVDKDLQAQRKSRWSDVFSEGTPFGTRDDLSNHRATLILEHIIQAADVVHNMQHWQIFQKWNARLFEEALLAYREGRGDYDPSEFWYDAQIGFFDNDVFPIVKKLKESGVFGASGDEYLEYASRNRREWVSRGKLIVAELSESLQAELSESLQASGKDLSNGEATEQEVAEEQEATKQEVAEEQEATEQEVAEEQVIKSEG
jgi:hypothetical protein